MADFDEAIRLRPEYARAYNNRGVAHKKRGDLDQALADYSEAIRGDPNYADAYHNRSVALAEKGDIERAKADQAKGKEIKSRRKKAGQKA